MTYKWIGAILIVASCGGAGFSMAARHRKEEALFHQMISAITYMESQLQFRLTPLPILCRQTARQAKRCVKKLFEVLATELEQQILPEASDCMAAALAQIPELPESVRRVLRELGNSLGQLDLTGQLAGLESACESCRRKLHQLETNREQRLRSYQTLGFCAGAALAILLI